MSFRDVVLSTIEDRRELFDVLNLPVQDHHHVEQQSLKNRFQRIIILS